MKKCRFCAEEIQDVAVKCRYCGEWLEEEPSNREPVRPLQGVQPAGQQKAVPSALGTAAAIAGGVALAELATSHQTVTTTVDAVVELSDAVSGVASTHEVITTTTEVAGGIFSSIWDYLFG